MGGGLSSPLFEIDMKISVIVAVYNGEKFLLETFCGLLNQTFQDFEVRIVDDCSTDRSWELISEFCKKRPEKFFCKRLERNSGCFKARQAAIDDATGKYLAIQDADDVSNEKRFERQVQYLEAHPAVAVVGGWALIVKDGQIINRWRYPWPIINTQVKFLQEHCHNPMIDSSTMINRSSYEWIGGYDLSEEIKLVADYDLWLRFLSAGCQLRNIAANLIRYRVHESQNTQNPEMKGQAELVWKRHRNTLVS